MMKRELELTFNTNLNKKARLLVPTPRDNLTPAEIATVMDFIIQKNIFGFPQGVALSKAGARILESNVVKIDV